MSGQKILDGLRDAVAGNFARVTIDGQTWVRQDRQNSSTLPSRENNNPPAKITEEEIAAQICAGRDGADPCPEPCRPCMAGAKNILALIRTGEQ